MFLLTKYSRAARAHGAVRAVRVRPRITYNNKIYTTQIYNNNICIQHTYIAYVIYIICEKCLQTLNPLLNPKPNRAQPGLTERFELFVYGEECAGGCEGYLHQ